MPKTCVLCKKRLKSHQLRPVNKHVSKYLRKHFLLEDTSKELICSNCFRPAYRENHHVAESQNHVQTVSVEATAQCLSPPSVSLNIKGAPKTHAYCFICKRPGPKLTVVNQAVRLDVFLKAAILIAPGSRCCPVHFDSNLENLLPSSISDIKTLNNVYVNRTTILELIQCLREMLQRSASRQMSFDNLELYTDEDIGNLTGLSKDQFLDLLETVKPRLRNTPSRSSQTTLGIFLLKMKSGISNKLLSTIFLLSKSSIRRGIHSARQALVQSFVPSHLGFSHVTRADVIENHTTTLAKSLFAESNDQAILVIDGTYVYIQKSNNFQFQRRCYSLHKGRPLVKPMVIVTSTGYFISVLGPYFADSKNNDASILKHIINQNVEQIKGWVQQSDIFIVDRGFRDSLQLLEDLGIQAEMPAFMVRGQRQMSTQDANTSRLVTKVRWVVEAANSRIKKWKYLDHILPTNQVPFIGDYVRIVCAISNRYFKPINSTKDVENDQALAFRMLHLSNQNSSLMSFVEVNKMDRKSVKWTSVENCEINFPKLDENKLRFLTLGIYQLRLSSSYIQEYVGGDCQIQVHKEADDIIRVRLQSRHISSKSYLLWIQYSTTDVLGWYCKCRAGARTVGTCSHVAAILWYLGSCIHENSNLKYGVKNWGDYLEDATAIPQTIDSSDSDESVVEE